MPVDAGLRCGQTSRLVHAAAGVWFGVDGVIEDQKLGSGLPLRGGADCTFVAAAAPNGILGRPGGCSAGYGGDPPEQSTAQHRMGTGVERCRARPVGCRHWFTEWPHRMVVLRIFAVDASSLHGVVS